MRTKPNPLVYCLSYCNCEVVIKLKFEDAEYQGLINKIS